MTEPRVKTPLNVDFAVAPCGYSCVCVVALHMNELITQHIAEDLGSELNGKPE